MVNISGWYVSYCGPSGTWSTGRSSRSTMLPLLVSRCVLGKVSDWVPCGVAGCDLATTRPRRYSKFGSSLTSRLIFPSKLRTSADRESSMYTFEYRGMSLSFLLFRMTVFRSSILAKVIEIGMWDKSYHRFRTCIYVQRDWVTHICVSK